MTDYSYDDFDFEKPLDEWTKQEKRECVRAAKDIMNWEPPSAE